MKIFNLQYELPIAIVGMGVSGLATKNLLLERNIPAHLIFEFDRSISNLTLEEFIKLNDPKTLCVSPGVPLSSPEVKSFISAGGSITSELELAASFLTSEKIIAITGSVGKSTVTSIIGFGGCHEDPNIFVGGNLGTPLASCISELSRGRKQAKYVVLELSSYQLENFKNLQSTLSVIVSLVPNHLERYLDKNHYYDTKLALLDKTTSVAILNKSGGELKTYLENTHKDLKNLEVHWVDRTKISKQNNIILLIGNHNLDNLALAIKVAEVLKWSEDSVQKMFKFPGLPHRLENCGWFKETLFINDSKATTIESVLEGIFFVSSNYPSCTIHLLVGGKDKNLPWVNLSTLKNNKNLFVSFFGAVGGTASSQSGLNGPVFSNLKSCLSSLQHQVKPNSIVLFSPGGTSLDEFKNFEERGDFFKSWVKNNFDC